MLYKLAIAPRQALRGSTNLPHVGHHPGTAFVIGMIVITAIAGGNAGGVIGAMLGALSGLVLVGSIYAIGGASRANLSDKLVRRDHMLLAFYSWANATEQPQGAPLSLYMEMRSGKLHTLLTGARDPLPEYLRAELEHILTRPVGIGIMRHRPTSSELKPLHTMVLPNSAHEKIEAIAAASRIKESHNERSKHVSASS